MESQEPIADSERLGPSNVLGVASTAGGLILILAQIHLGLGIRLGDNHESGLAVHFHTFINPDRDYISVTEIERDIE